MANVSSSNSHKGLYPHLRFSEFLEQYTPTVIGNIYDERSERGTEEMELLSVTMNDGVKRRFEIEGKDNSSEDKSNYKVVHIGDMVYNSMRMWQGASGISQYNGIVSPAYTVLKPKTKISNDYFAALFKTQKLINEFQKNSQGLTSDTWNLKYPQISKIKIAIPEIKEQIKVAKMLSLLNLLIDKQTQLVSIFKSYKRGLIFSIYSDDNAFGIPMTLTPLFNLLTEYRVKDTKDLRVCSVAVNKGVVDQIEHLGRSFSATDTSNYGRVKFGDIVYTKSPTGDFPYGIVKQNKLNEVVAVSPLYGVYTPKTFEVGNLLHYYFEQHENANNYIRPLAQKGAKNTINITNQTFLQGMILFPHSDSDCVRLCHILNVIEQNIVKQEKLLLCLQQQKKWLLQKMFI